MRQTCHLLSFKDEFFVFHLLSSVSRYVDEQEEASLPHLPLVQEESWRDCEELLKVGLSEIPAEALRDHVCQLVKRNGPLVVSRPEQTEVDFKLLEQSHQVVQVLWQRQVENLLRLNLLVFFRSLCSLVKLRER